MQKKSKLTVFTFMMLIILGLTFQPAISTYAAYPAELISYWKLDETAGPDYVDSFGDNDGTGGSATGAADPTAVTGQVKGAQLFGGTAEINVPADESFNWAVDDSFSIELWIKRFSAFNGDNEVAIGRNDGDPSTNLHWWVGIRGSSPNVVNFTLGDSDGPPPGELLPAVTGDTDITDNVWHHVVAVRDSSAGQNLLYVDGQLDAPALDVAYNAGFGSSTAELNIGYLDLNQLFHLQGGIDEVALYDRALTPEEIEQHYDAGKDGRGIDTQITEIIGTWTNGIWYWDMTESEWIQMTTDVTTGDIAAGDFNGDGIADVASSWENYGLWYQDGATLDWTRLDDSPAYSLTAGDVTGDHRDELIGTGPNGIRYWDFVASAWTQMTADVTTGDIAAGDFNGDGIADVASSWKNYGLWYQDGATLDWTKLDDSPAYSLAAGDVTGDGRVELIGSWPNGIWYWDFVASAWTQMTADVTTGDIAAGYINNDDIADVASSWNNGLWYQDGATLDWTKLDDSPAFRLTAGDLTGQ